MTVPLEQAQTQLGQLIDKAAAGEEMAITRDGRAVARLVPEHAFAGGTAGVSVGAGSNPARVLGSAKGLIRIADDFDAPLAEFREYME